MLPENDQSGIVEYLRAIYGLSDINEHSSFVNIGDRENFKIDNKQLEQFGVDYLEYGDSYDADNNADYLNIFKIDGSVIKVNDERDIIASSDGIFDYIIYYQSPDPNRDAETIISYENIEGLGYLPLSTYSVQQSKPIFGYDKDGIYFGTRTIGEFMAYEYPGLTSSIELEINSLVKYYDNRISDITIPENASNIPTIHMGTIEDTFKLVLPNTTIENIVASVNRFEKLDLLNNQVHLNWAIETPQSIFNILKTKMNYEYKVPDENSGITTQQTHMLKSNSPHYLNINPA